MPVTPVTRAQADGINEMMALAGLILYNPREQQELREAAKAVIDQGFGESLEFPTTNEIDEFWQQGANTQFFWDDGTNTPFFWDDPEINEPTGPKSIQTQMLRNALALLAQAIDAGERGDRSGEMDEWIQSNTLATRAMAEIAAALAETE